MICFSLVVILCIAASDALPAPTLLEVTTSLPDASDEINVTASSIDETPIDAKNVADQNPGILDRIFNLINIDNEPIVMPITRDCSFPSPSQSVIKNVEYQYFCYRIRVDGITRFDLLRQSSSSIKSYSEFKHLLFPSPSEKNHPFFECAFDMFFNYMMNRTPYVWLHWALFDGARFPFVRWQKVNV
jgi:hypothetical protein